MEVIYEKNSKKVFGYRVELDGKSYLVDYEVKHGMITVWHGGNHRTTQIGGSTQHAMVVLLLMEMLREENNSGENET